MSILRKWASFTHRSREAYLFRVRGVLQPLHTLASLTPWDQPRVFADFDQEVTTFLREALSGCSVLDVGCGPGDYALIVAWKYTPAWWVGTDLFLGMLQDAKEKFPAYQFVASDACALPFADKSFDAIYCESVFHHLSIGARSRVISEMCRVAGRFVCIKDLFGFDNPLLNLAYRMYYSVADGSYYRFRLKEWEHFLSPYPLAFKAHLVPLNSLVNSRLGRRLPTCGQRRGTYKSWHSGYLSSIKTS